MIATKIREGLGNQMFIYAAARAMALRNDVPLVLDTHSCFEQGNPYGRKYGLHCFNIKYQSDRFRTLDYMCGNKVYGLSRRLGRNILFPKQRFFVQGEDNAVFFPEMVESKNKEAFISGYWQNERYFNDYADQIREDFSFVKKFPAATLRELDKIKKQGDVPVALGVRLYQECDFDFGKMNKEYYLKAMEYIAERFPNAIFYAFSQVQDWVRENLDDGRYNIVYIEPKVGEDSAADDMMLFSSCKHHIISNSTFYWWGAWLAEPNPEHIVVAPKSWQTVPCENWVKL